MRFLHVAFGTHGDVLPHIGLGYELRKRGHKVSLLACDAFRPLAEERDIEFISIFSKDEFETLLKDPIFWHPAKSGVAAARWGKPRVMNEYRQLEQLVQKEPTIMVATPGVISTRLIQDKLGIPMANLIMQPSLILSQIEPPVMPTGPRIPHWLPGPAKRAYFKVLDLASYFIVGRDTNRFRAMISLPPFKRFFDWWFSPDLVIGMFPDWYGKPQADWPKQIELVGFPIGVCQDKMSLPSELTQFLDDGEPPIVFTFGTGMMHAQKQFAESVTACTRMGKRGLFLTRYPHQLPPELPNTIRHFQFAPLQALLPRCAALVHHGGMGTMSHALAAGIPQLITPLAWDQPDNAHRVKRLGVGDWIKKSKYKAPRIITTLDRILKPTVTNNCIEISKRFKPNALQRACDLIEERLLPLTANTPS